MARKYSDRPSGRSNLQDVPELTSESESDSEMRYKLPHYATPPNDGNLPKKVGPGTPQRPIKIPDTAKAGTPDEPIWISDVDGTDTETDTSIAAVRGTRKSPPAKKVPPSNAFKAGDRPRSKSREGKSSTLRQNVVLSSEDEQPTKLSPPTARPKVPPMPASKDPRSLDVRSPSRVTQPTPSSPVASPKESPKRTAAGSATSETSPAAGSPPRAIRPKASTGSSAASIKDPRTLANVASATSEETPTTSNHLGKKSSNKKPKSKRVSNSSKKTSNPFDVASLANEGDDPMLEKELEEIALNGRSGLISGNPGVFDVEKGNEETSSVFVPPALPLGEDEADRSWHTPIRTDKPKTTKRQRWFLFLSVIGFIIITTCLIFVLAGNKKVDDGEDFEANLSDRQKALNTIILRVTDSATLSNEKSPQSKARRWLLFRDRELSTAEEEPVIQRYALACFYFSTGGDTKWSDNNWLSEEECGATPWNGLDCNSDGEVKTLVLDNAGLAGTIPSEVGHLYKLENLILKNNPGLFGWIPTTLAHVKSLSQLGLYSNALSGTIPDVFQHANQIRYINLEDNNMYGSIPLGIQHLTKLDTLALANNRFDGMIPVEQFAKTTLKYLSLSHNEFSSMLEHSIKYVTTLEHIYLDNNKMRGPIPREIVALTNLKSLDLGGNQFTGTVPTEIGKLQRLEFLSMSSNQLKGTIPNALIFLTNLKALNLASNALVGTLPNISNMSRLVNLQLYENKLTGSIPDAVQQLQNLEVLSLASNKLVGTIPRTIRMMGKTLRGLYLSDNQIQGRIPTELCAFASLEALFLDTNKLFGPIPSCLGDLSNLQQLFLFQNQLTGQVPSTFGDLKQLKGLGLEENGLTGEMPDGVCSLVDDSKLDIWADCTDQFGSDPLLCDCCSVCCPSDKCI